MKQKIGIICYPKHRDRSKGYELLGIRDRLEKEGIQTDFFHPEKELSQREMEDIDLIWGKESKVPVYETLKRLEREDVDSVNGYYTHLLADSIPQSYQVLERTGLKVPEWGTAEIDEKDEALYSYRVLQEEGKTVSDLRLNEMPEGTVVTKDISESMEGSTEVLNGCNYEVNKVYQEFIENSGWDYKLYGIDTGEGVEAFGARERSPLLAPEGKRRPIRVDGEIREDVNKIMDAFGAKVLSIDMIEDGGKRYVVDVNSSPNPRGIPGIKEGVYKCLKGLLGDHEAR
ncbi:MAG: RimK family alpha-L-glutamate ligase [Candidatus Aenigmatarchaeota archaeon]